LSADERATIANEFGEPADRVALLLSLYDADESGALDASELGQLQSDVQARCEQREAAPLAQFDTDGDGQLSDAEREAARAALRAPSPGRSRRRRRRPGRWLSGAKPAASAASTSAFRRRWRRPAEPRRAPRFR